MGIRWECNTSITTSHMSRAGIPSIRKPASSEKISDPVERWWSWRFLLTHPTDGDKCSTSQNTQDLSRSWFRVLKITRKSLSAGINPIDNAEPCYLHDNIVGRHLCDECMKLFWPNVFHKLESIWWLIGQVCGLTIECQVHQFVPYASISRHFLSIVFIILQLIQVLPSWKCGEVEDVVGALTPFGRGVAQVFHDLLVELRLLLVAEVEEGEEEEGQEEGEEVKGGSQVEETTTTWMAMMMVVNGVRTRLELEPMWVWWNVQGTRLRAHAQWNCLWMCTLWSATQSLMCCVVQLSTSSLVFTLSCFSSRLLVFTLSSWFSLLWYWINSYNSLPVAIFHIWFHCIPTAFLVWYLHTQSVTVDRRQL